MITLLPSIAILLMTNTEGNHSFFFFSSAFFSSFFNINLFIFYLFSSNKSGVVIHSGEACSWVAPIWGENTPRMSYRSSTLFHAFRQTPIGGRHVSQGLVKLSQTPQREAMEGLDPLFIDQMKEKNCFCSTSEEDLKNNIDRVSSYRPIDSYARNSPRPFLLLLLFLFSLFSCCFTLFFFFSLSLSLSPCSLFFFLLFLSLSSLFLSLLASCSSSFFLPSFLFLSDFFLT